MKVSAGTIARTVVLALALLNQTLTILGKNPLNIAEEDIYTVVSTAATIIAAAVAWWKNNSFTKKAIEADAYLDGLRKE